MSSLTRHRAPFIYWVHLSSLAVRPRRALPLIHQARRPCPGNSRGVLTPHAQLFDHRSSLLKCQTLPRQPRAHLSRLCTVRPAHHHQRLLACATPIVAGSAMRRLLCFVASRTQHAWLHPCPRCCASSSNVTRVYTETNQKASKKANFFTSLVTPLMPTTYTPTPNRLPALAPQKTFGKRARLSQKRPH